MYISAGRRKGRPKGVDETHLHCFHDYGSPEQHLEQEFYYCRYDYQLEKNKCDKKILNSFVDCIKTLCKYTYSAMTSWSIRNLFCSFTAVQTRTKKGMDQTRRH